MQKVCVHTCCDTCHPAPDNLANDDSLPDNEDIASACTMKSRDERVTTKDVAPNSNAVAVRGSTFNLLLRKATPCAGVLGRLYRFWIPCSGPVSTPNAEFSEGHSRTWDTYGAQWSRSKLFR